MPPEDEPIENQPEPEQEVEELPPPEDGFEYSLNEAGEVEYDEYGEPVVVPVIDQEPEQEQAEAPAEETEEEPVSISLPQGEGPASVKLREALADPEISALLDAAMEEKVNRKLQAFGVSQAAYAQAAAEHPEVFKKYGSKINMTLAMFPEQERHTRKSVDLATMFAVTEGKAGTPEFGRELMKLAQQITKTSAAPKPPKAPIPAANRPPTPSSGVRSQAVSRREATLKLIMKDASLTREEAEEVIKGGR